MQLLPVPAGIDDLTGRCFGRLVVIGLYEESQRHGGVGQKFGWRRRWLCQCSCGKQTTPEASELKRGSSRSCGCWRAKHRKSSSRRYNGHGLSRSPEYRIWVAMKSRCNDKNNVQYRRYGARGIKVCPRWERDFSGNCKWATAMEQGANKYNNVMVHAFGKSKHMSQWAREYGINRVTLRHRILVQGMNPEKALGGSAKQ